MVHKTTTVKLDPLAPDRDAIRMAARLLLDGETVAFPTETVYGLGANALDEDAVRRIFEAKGRPPHNPLIVHVGDADSAQAVVSDWPDAAERLAAKFWPGPLSMVLPKSDRIPSIVTAGGATVAVRSPDHAIALALLRGAGVPLAAPSANRSSEVSPTRAEHVLKSLGGRIPLILDGGPCPGGVESTVLDLTTDPARILRPGLITATMLEPVIGKVEYLRDSESSGLLRSPGLLDRHYAPKATVKLIDADESHVAVEAAEQLRVGFVALKSQNFADSGNENLQVIEMPDEPSEYAARIYGVLHALDDWGADLIVVTNPPGTDDWRAIRDRLVRATST